MATPPPTVAAATAAAKKHIIICGGGVIGACTAYFLSTTSSSITATLIEKSSIACAASGKAGGFLALDWCDSSPLSSLARASFALHLSLSQSLLGPTSYAFRPLHTLSLSLQNNNKNHFTTTNHNNLPGWVDGPVDQPPRTIGTPETTAQVHPQLFARALVSKAVEDHGLEVVIGEVARVEVDSGRAVGVVMKDGTFRAADVVVLALGPWSSRSEVLNRLFRISGLRAHSIVLKPKEMDLITPHALFLNYRAEPGGKMLDPEVYPRPSGEVYICGMTKEFDVPDDPEDIVGEKESFEMLHKIAGTVSSHLSDGEVEVLAEQACVLPCTDDGLPVIGEIPGVAGCYVATGHNCWGILNGPATGAALAELILNGHSTLVDLKPFSPLRFLGKNKKPGN